MYCESSIFGAQSLFHFQPPENQALHTVDFIRDAECSAKTWRFQALSHQGGPQDHPKFASFDVPRRKRFCTEWWLSIAHLFFESRGLMIQRLDNHIHKWNQQPATSIPNVCCSIPMCASTIISCFYPHVKSWLVEISDPKEFPASITISSSVG